ncbi:rhomboid family intramembrane serine protease [Actinomadura hibisca]|uniref:rhomboid family intramembrane serine protease n=1 Tax=Actinomadura hibisca TaxID=68565 RepID=UPI00083599BB|nr:rhomboid family intramembrane serine protease [Actinomadura hibisca]
MSNDPATEAPTCYRHPGQETHVRCTRCDRYICPDCMRDAAVGHQCVECVAEGNRGVRRARTVRPGRPVVTYTLIGLCLLAYAVEVVWPRVVDEFAMVGWVWPEGAPKPLGVAEGEWWRPVTSMFLHQPPDEGFGPAHILFNMWALWAVGSQLEVILGRWRFLALYMLAGLGGSTLLCLVSPATAAIGASGAIFGLFGAFFVYSRKLGAPMGPIVFLLVLNLMITFGADGISWQAHIGGLVVGGLLAAVFAHVRRPAVHVAASALTLVLLVGLMAVKAQELTSGVA